MKYPKVGDKFYWMSMDGELVESTCVHIERKPGIVPQYFTSWDEGGGLFINETSILDPESDEVKELIAKKEKDDWRKFWTDEHIEEMIGFLTKSYACSREYSTLVFKDFIKEKIK